MIESVESTYPPELFALVHRGTPGDVEFYARLCEGTQNVLELGCGYGRLIPELVATGTHYHGLELSPELLRMAKRVVRALPERKRARVSLRRGDMRSFHYDKQFDRILLPHSTLFCLPTDCDVLRCLRNAREHLADGGELVLDAYTADDFHYRLDPKELNGKARDYLTQVTGKGGGYLVFERTHWLRSKQRFVVTYEYESERGKLLKGMVQHRYLLRGQLEALLERAGFASLKWAGSFKGGRLSTRSEQLVVRARLPKR